jgi:hypothetical protein
MVRKGEEILYVRGRAGDGGDIPKISGTRDPELLMGTAQKEAG